MSTNEQTDYLMEKSAKLIKVLANAPMCTDACHPSWTLRLNLGLRNAIVDTGGGIFFKNGQKARDKCLENLSRLPYPCQSNGLEKVWDKQDKCNNFETKFHAVVIGGQSANRSSYPHMALLGYGEDVISAQWLCGGSLISDRFILTAAHCLSETVIGPVTLVALGILKRSDPMELWQIYKVRRIIKHPEYAPPSKYNDIALLEVDRSVKYSKDVFPACLDFGSTEHYSAEATGWGKLGKNQPLADNLQMVILEKFSDEKCLKNYPPHRLLKKGYDAKTQLCYGDPNEPKDTCEILIHFGARNSMVGLGIFMVAYGR
ncbi:unnamed protein product [Spodoptera exigua]|nr:unnamed protein product [Spodoptera exigua]